MAVNATGAGSAKVQAPTAVAVVGAGVVGVATALALQSYGVAVTLIDRGEPGMECSYGNSGAISPGSVAPLALPGVLKTVPGMLMDQDGPLSISWKYAAKAASWLVAFAQSADPKRVAAAAATPGCVFALQRAQSLPYGRQAQLSAKGLDLLANGIGTHGTGTVSTILSTI